MRRGDTWKAISRARQCPDVDSGTLTERAQSRTRILAQAAQAVTDERPIDATQRRDVPDETDHGQVEKASRLLPCSAARVESVVTQRCRQQIRNPSGGDVCVRRVLTQLGRCDDGMRRRCIGDPVMIE